MTEPRQGRDMRAERIRYNNSRADGCVRAFEEIANFQDRLYYKMDAVIEFQYTMMAAMQQTMMRLNNVQRYLNDIEYKFQEKKLFHFKITIDDEEEDGRPRKKIKVEKEEDGKDYITNLFVAEN